MDLEEKRLEALRQYNILDTPPEEAFDNLAKLATHICGTSSAQINFIDADRQWTKANVGWGGKEMPREHSFCTHTIASDNAEMIISDAREHEFFKQNPLVDDKPPLRFYAGVAVHSVDNYPLGTICVFDSEPQDIPTEDMEALHTLAEEVEAHLELRVGQDQLKKILEQENQLNQQIISSLPVNFFMYDAQGQLVRWNEQVPSTTGYSEEDIKQMTPTDFFSGDARKKMKEKVEEVFAGDECQFEITIDKKDGTTAPFLLGMSRFTMDEEQYLIGTAQDLTHQKQTQHKLETLLQQFGKFVPEQFIQHLNGHTMTNVQLGDQTNEDTTIFFADIHGFTTASEAMSSEENFRFLNAFLKRIVPCIREHNGIIDKYIGDGVMALFPEQPADAIFASIAMQQAIKQYNNQRKRDGRTPISFSVGLHYGEVQLGIIGDPERYQATIISDDVNQAFRIEELANKYDAPLLMSEPAYQQIDDKGQFTIRQLGEFKLKGKQELVSICEVIDGDLSRQGELKAELQAPFNEGMELYNEGRFAEASNKFSQILQENPDDTAANIYLNKASSKIGTNPE